MIDIVMCSGICNSDSDDYCGMHLRDEECPACAAIKAQKEKEVNT
jgi:hypothetical protein